MTTNELIDIFAGGSWEESLGTFFIFFVLVIILFVIKKTSAGDRTGNKKGEDEDEDT